MREEEIRRYEQMLAEDPDSRAFAPLAEAYRKAGDLDKALATAHSGLRIHPDYVGGLVVAGRVMLEKGDYKKASDALTKAVNDAPENLIAQKSLAKTAIALGEFDTARQALKAAMLLSPEDGEIVADLDRVEQAAAKASKATGQVYDPVPDMEIEEMVSSGTAGLQDHVSLAGEPDVETGVAEMPPDQPGDPSPGGRDLPPLSDDQGLSQEPESQDITGDASREMIPQLESQEEPVDFVPFPVSEEVPEGPLQVEEPEVSGVQQAQEQMPPEGGVQDSPSGEPEIATETLADLYADQGEPEKAARIYKQLLDSEPADEEVASKLKGLDDKVAEPTPTVKETFAGPEGEAGESKIPQEDLVETLEAWLENVERMRPK